MSNGINFNNINPYVDGQYTFANKNFYSNDVDDFYPLFDLDEKSFDYDLLEEEFGSTYIAPNNKKNDHNEVISSGVSADNPTITKNTEIIDENGNVVGEAKIDYDYNKYGNVVNRYTTIYDLEGNKVGKTKVEYTYNAFGKVESVKWTSYETKADGTQVEVTKTLDEKGRVINESNKETKSDGSSIETKRTFGYSGEYNGKYYANSISEEVISKDKEGKTIYKTKSSSEINQLEVLKKLYPNSSSLKNCKNFKDALNICKREGLDTDINEKLINELCISVKTEACNITEMSEEMVLSVVDELEAKLDLMAINDEKKGQYLKLLDQIRKNDNSHYMYKYNVGSSGRWIWRPENNYNGRKPDGKRLVENTLDRLPELQKLYEEINTQMYPDGSHGNLAHELVEIQASKNYFNQIDETLLDDSLKLSDNFDPEKNEPKTYGDYLYSQLNDFKEKYKNKDELLLMDQRITELCEAFGYSVTMENIGKMLEKYETELKNVLNTGNVIDTSEIALYINKTLEDNNFSQSIPKEFSISKNYDPETMSPNNYGEMLMEEMNDLKKEYELYKDQMGCFDRIVSLCNVFGFGTSESEVEDMFKVYESELKKLSTYENDDFIARFKAITGNDFSEESLTNIATYNIISESIDNLSENELLQQASALGINLNDFKYRAIVGKTHEGRGNEYETRINYDDLSVAIKEILTSGINQDNTPVNKSIEDWTETVKEHRDFVVDLARTTATAIVSSTGVGVIGCAVTGAVVESFALAMNSNAKGEQRISVEEAAANIVSGAISSGFQGGAKRFLNGLGLSYEGDTKNLGSIYKIIEKLFNKNDYTIMNKTLFKFCELFGLKGVSAGAIKQTSNILFEERDIIMKMCNGEATEKEQEDFMNKIVNGIWDGSIDGAVTGVLLVFFDFINSKTAKKIHDNLKVKIDNTIDKATQSGEGVGLILNAQKILNECGFRLTSATGKTATRTAAKLISGDDVDFASIMETEIKEIAKETFK